MFRIAVSAASYSNRITDPAEITHRSPGWCIRRSRGSGMPPRIAATAADMPLSYQTFKNYAHGIPDKTARHGLHVCLLPEIWDRLCTTCGGQSRHRRWGVQLLYPQNRTWAERTAVEARKRRGAPR